MYGAGSVEGGAVSDRSWRLMQGDTQVGTLVLDHIDQPWFHCRFTATPDWEPLRPVVETWTRVVESDDSDELQITQALEAVDALHLTLLPVSGSEEIDDFLIHVDGDAARFRY
ncbi:hypothetical protein [Streptomyces xinghaiensis]|uniref:hypothetical protein n=1 Tax=Streptomyces xinghaiensis TaxID=1038928 RepID=UPI002E14029A|nr:hypothetical protein OG463_15320 [Streptomyces xinghaiensis]